MTPSGTSTRRRWLVGMAGLGAAAAVAAQPAGAPHATRPAQSMAELEERLLQGARARDPAGLAALLAVDFEMIVAQAPTAPVAREDWIGAMCRPGAADWAVQGLSARALDDVAVAAFILRPTRGRAAPLYVVDTWRHDAAGWRLVVRHVAPAGGPRRGIPGDVQAPVVPKKF